MRKKRETILYSIMAAVIIWVFGALYISYNGNPVRLYLVKRQVERHLAESYPGITFTDIKAHYRMKLSSYEGTAIAQLDEPVEVTIYKYNAKKYVDTLARTILTPQALAEVTPIVHTALPSHHIKYVSLDWGRVTRHFERNILFSRDIPFGVIVGLQWDHTTSPENLVDGALLTLQGLRDAGYDVTSLYMSYNENEARRESLGIYIEPQDLCLSRDEIMHKVQHHQGYY